MYKEKSGNPALAHDVVRGIDLTLEINSSAQPL
jgi:hypothetical protein